MQRGERMRYVSLMSHDEKRFDPERAHILLDPVRLARWDPENFLGRFAIEPGQAVLDVGSGPGFWTLPLAKIVGPTGVVWALDGSRDLLTMLAERQPPSHVHPIWGELPGIELPAAAVDLAWAAFVYHEVPQPETLASELRRVLKPGGTAAILEWRPDAVGEAGPPRSHRVQPAQVIAWLSAAGFADPVQSWQDDDAYLVEAR
jgi:ubiquinone/menaquinone biosynthesis C-methylase UbiE